MRTPSAWFALPLLLAGCNRYALFDVAGYEQATFSNDADILFIIDNSSSMTGEATSLALNFNEFIQTLTDAAGGTPPTEDLSDAVDNYAAYIEDRGRFLDYQLAITTTTVDYATEGATAGVDPGEAGLLLGDPTVLTKDAVDVAGGFQRNLLCEATCWSASSLDSDPSYQCGDDPAGVITEEYLDCICGPDAWKDHCGTGNEEHLEATLLALCRAVPEPPEACYFDLSPFEEGDAGSNPGLLREGATTVVVIVTDEGDSSRRIDNGNADPAIYEEALAEFERTIRVAVIGPPYDAENHELLCNSGGATTWGTERLQTLAADTVGFYNDIADTQDPDCAISDFSVHLNDLGDLLNSLKNVFTLQAVPDESTIRVYVDDVPVDPGSVNVDDETAAVTYGDGWHYDPSQNAVVFTGAAIPDYNQDVRIYFLPLEGKPRDLPF